MRLRVYFILLSNFVLIFRRTYVARNREPSCNVSSLMPSDLNAQRKTSQSQLGVTWAMPIDMTKLPILDDSKQFEEWRRYHLEILNTPRSELVKLLLDQATPLSQLRASMLLTTTDSVQSRELAALALQQATGTSFHMARAQLAILDTIDAWTGSENPKFKVEPALIVLENILQEVIGLKDRGSFTLEIIVRVHHMLADGYMLTQNFEAVRSHAAEAIVMSKAIGFGQLTAASHYQLATIAYTQGEVNNADSLFNQIIQDPSASNLLHGKATCYQALVFAALGDDDGVEENLLRICNESSHSNYWLSIAIRYQTLRFDWEFNDNKYKLKVPNTTRILVEFYQFISEAQKKNPDRYSEIQDLYSQADAILHTLIQTSLGWRQIDQRILSAFVSLRLKERSIAQYRLPSLEEIRKLPPASRLFGLCVSIEVLERNLPITSNELWQFLQETLRELTKFDTRILNQVTKKLQLMTPLALALVARLPGAPNIVSNLGNKSILNLKTRPISIFDQQGIRPTQAIQYILEAFDHETDFLGRLGGGQLESLKACLFRDYYHRQCWFQPVTSAQIAYSIMCCSEVARDSVSKRQLVRSVIDLKNRFGLVPQPHKKEFYPNLEQISMTLDLLISGDLTTHPAAKLLFGKGGRL
jgi:hypothetical protein